jgi:hypothetical protein
MNHPPIIAGPGRIEPSPAKIFDRSGHDDHLGGGADAGNFAAEHSDRETARSGKAGRIKVRFPPEAVCFYPRVCCASGDRGGKDLDTRTTVSATAWC